MIDLELVSTDDLVLELKNRFDNFIVAGQKHISGQNSTRYMAFKHDNPMAAIGLCSTLQNTMLIDLEDEAEDLEEDDIL